MATGEPSQTAPGPLPATPSRWWSGLVRRKKHLGRLTLIAVTTAACLPLLLALSRILAWPGGKSPALAVLEPLRALGALLNRHFVFDWVSPGDRHAILFLLLLPTGALLVAVVRLIFGIRVLGLRAILLAIGFQAIGLLPGLSLMLVVIAVIVLIRPWIQRIRLPMYARITFIVSLSALIMVGAALVAPWLGSDTVWRAAFFPVVIMAMIAEGLASTLEQHDLVMAVWRGSWTIVVALLLVLIDQPVLWLTYQFPELILTQLMAIVLIAELFDLRLLEEWPARLSRLVAGARPWYTGRPKVAVVRNREATGVIAPLGRPAPPGYSEQAIQRLVDALRRQGLEVRVFEGDMTLLSELARYLPPDPRRLTPGGIVLNLATGVQGEGRFTQVPAMLEMAGIPYTGPGPVAHARLADRFALMTLLAHAQVPVPRHFLVSDPTGALTVEFPASARPRFEPDADRTIVRDRRSLRHAVREIRGRFGQATVVEAIVLGRKLSVALLGNDTPECLPLVETSPGAAGKACPAPLDEAVADRVRTCARAAYRAAGCRDYARVDLRLPPSNDPVVVDVKWADLFARQGAFVTAAEAAGYGFPTMMRRIVAEAARRYVVSQNPSGTTTEATAVVSLPKTRAATAATG
jgi:D-alanine-D-alanine ligase